MSVTVHLDPAAIHRLLDSPDGLTGQLVTRIGNQIVTGAKQRANVDTGLMRSRVEFTLETGVSGLQGIVAARTDYAYFVHEGTRYMEGNPFLTDAAAEVLR